MTRPIPDMLRFIMQHDPERAAEVEEWVRENAVLRAQAAVAQANIEQAYSEAVREATK